ncbi:MAG: hypothetical protein CENE_03759 [Candidatus Celerinatantimonas neptuna]|nr:MAG: hypothetical protein CENE_03759 [Candidatus Celerinatantimonas neptuna]
MVLVGKWAMPTTVILVLITCLSGYFLKEGAFTPVVGMIAPVVMALIMMIEEASVGKEEDEVLKDREKERMERMERLKKYQLENELRLAQLKSEGKRHQQDMAEKARQFDINTASTKEFVDLAREMNAQLAEIMKKETDLVVGDTRIKVSDDGTKVSRNKDKK